MKGKCSIRNQYEKVGDAYRRPLQAGQSAQILCQNLVVLAAFLDVGKTGVEHVNQLLVVGVEDGEAIVAARVGGVLQTLQSQTLMEACIMGVSSKQATH